MRCWHPEPSAPEWAYTDQALFDRFFSCLSSQPRDRIPLQVSGARCASADPQMRGREWAMIRDGHCLLAQAGILASRVPSLSQEQISKFKGAQATSDLAELLSSQGQKCFEGSSSRSRSHDPLFS